MTSATSRSDGAGRVDVGLARQVLLEDVVLHRATKNGRVHALLLADHLVHGEQDRCGGVDRERRRDAAQGDPVEDRLHVGQRRDGHADLADLGQGQRLVGVEAHLRGKVECHAEAGLPAVEQITEPHVRVLGGAPAGVEPDRPGPAAVHRRVDPAGEWRLPWEADLLDVVRVDGAGARPVDRLDGDPRVGRGLAEVACRFAPARVGRRQRGLSLSQALCIDSGHDLGV